MPLFGFGDITFNKGTSSRKGPLAPLVSGQFQTNNYRYPMDLGNYDKGHYMVFYIREQETTQFKGSPANENAFAQARETQQAQAKAQIQGAIKAATSANIPSNFGGQLVNKINNGLNQINSATGGALSGITSAASKALGGAVGNLNNVFGQKSIPFGGNSQATQTVVDNSIKEITTRKFLNTTRLTTDTVALYMPDTLSYTYTQSYDQLSLGGELLGQAAAAGISIAEAIKGGEGAVESIRAAASSGGENLKLIGGQKAAGAIGKLTGSAQSAQLGFTAATGKVQNPMLEMIYKSPNFRSFQFDFTFYPRDEREALEVQRIIERFRFHQAPELYKEAQGFLIPPSEFDIKFYYGGNENPNIPPVATCILTSIDVNYAPNGFAAYEIPGENQPSLGRTGMPVAIQMGLQFQETRYLTKQDFRNDRSSGIVKNINDQSNRIDGE